MKAAALSLSNIGKAYPGVLALNDFSVDFLPGEVHALLGENGAGKSTLIKVISGAIEPDCGTIELDGIRRSRMNPLQAKKLGIEVIYQEFNLVESLSVAHNVFLGETRGRFVNNAEIEKRARAVFADFGVEMDVSRKVAGLSPAKMQLVEIAKAISRNARILIMDEPSAPLSASEVDLLFTIVGRLKAQGVTIIYISHRMEELFRIADRVTVMRDGQFIKTLVTSETDSDALVSLMVGRELKAFYPLRTTQPGDVALETRGVSGNGDSDICIKARKGEVLGIAGLVGAGRTELANVIFGSARRDSGEILVNGCVRNIRSPLDAIRSGIGLIPEDRKLLGCILDFDVAFNITMAILPRLSAFGIIDKKKRRKQAVEYHEKLNIKTPNLEQRVRNLSGGNQQKVVLAKTLATNSDILIFDEPTRGIDVGAKQEIYKLMNELAAQGKAIIMISSDMEELVGMSDRIYVLHEGRCAGELARPEFDQRTIIKMASGE